MRTCNERTATDAPKDAREHGVQVMRKDVRTARFHTKSWSYAFVCSICGRARRQNVNYLGSDVLVCDGSRAFRMKKVAP